MSTRTTLPTGATTLAPEPAGSAAGRSLTGTWPLVRLALRRDRILLPVWLVVFVGMAGSTASSTLALYPDIASRRGIATTINGNPAMLALYGRIYDIDSAGAVAMFKVNALGSALVAVLTSILLVRHSRAEEEAGRLELLGAGVVGRLAPLTAALVVAAGTAMMLGLLTAASLAAAGLPTAGSLAFGLSWSLTGLAFTGVAAIAAQLTTGARTANGLTGAVLGATYLLRAVGDVADEHGPRWASWLSPVGWAQQVRAFSGERWWVFALGLAFTALAVAAAYRLAAGRDIGAGLLADSAGPARAGRGLAGPVTLALRLQRAMLIAWTGAMILLGLVVGSLGQSIDAFLDSPSIRDLVRRMGGSTSMIDAFFGTEQGVIAIIVSVFALQSVLRLHGEEAALRAEPLLATPVGRRAWAGSHLLVAALGSVWLLLVAGAGMGLTAAMSLHDGSWFPRLLAGQLQQAAAVLVMIGIAAACFGLVPRLVTAGWAFLVGFLLLGELGPVFSLDRRVLDVSPFEHVPRLGTSGVGSLVALLAVAAVLVVAGVEGFRRRDVG